MGTRTVFIVQDYQIQGVYASLDIALNNLPVGDLDLTETSTGVWKAVVARPKHQGFSSFSITEFKVEE